MGEHKGKERPAIELTDQWKLDGHCKKSQAKRQKPTGRRNAADDVAFIQEGNREN